MIPDHLIPTGIADVVDRMNEYMESMRSMEHREVMRFVQDLEDYIAAYFTREELHEQDLKKLIVEATDTMYRTVANLAVRDIHTSAYFGIVLNRLYWELGQKNIFVFSVVDNSIRDDRFKLLVELFHSAHFATVYPYQTTELEHSENYTALPTKPFTEVGAEIDLAVSRKQHILYVEKDASVNYLNDVLAIAEGIQNQYQCVFRNKSIEDTPGPNWLMGSFADLVAPLT